MSIGTLIRCNSDGLIRDSSVYILLCQDDGPIYFKVGMSTRPLKRLHALRNGCPVSPQIFSYLPMHGRQLARKLEKELLSGFEKWRRHGEWFVISEDDKAEFNRIQKNCLFPFLVSGWDPNWNQINVPAYVKEMNRRLKFHQQRWKRRGRAFQDFTRDCAG